MYLSITYTVETKIKWLVKGYDSYGFGIDKELYNLHTNHKKKKSIKNGMIGYWIDRKFISLTKLRTLIYIPKEDYLPF